MVSRITVTGVAVTAALVVFLVAKEIGIDLQIPNIGSQPTTDMGPENVLLVSILVGFGAMGVAGFADRYTADGRLSWSIVALAVLAGSFVPLSQLNLSGMTLIWQALLHIVYGLVLIGGFWATWDQKAAAEAATSEETRVSVEAD